MESLKWKRQHMPTAAQSRNAVSAKATVEMAMTALDDLPASELIEVLKTVIDGAHTVDESQMQELADHVNARVWDMGRKPA